MVWEIGDLSEDRGPSEPPQLAARRATHRPWGHEDHLIDGDAGGGQDLLHSGRVTGALLVERAFSELAHGDDGLAAGLGRGVGHEDDRVILPVVDRLIAEGMALEGPVPADTAFHPPRLERCDAVVAMYHDQGLPVLKHMGFGRSVNVTLGLPIVRTSVDHGTALDLAGTGEADEGSLISAIDLARQLIAR